jgi:Zn/Cd-binding protein ZinT
MKGLTLISSLLWPNNTLMMIGKIHFGFLRYAGKTRLPSSEGKRSVRYVFGGEKQKEELRVIYLHNKSIHVILRIGKNSSSS